MTSVFWLKAGIFALWGTLLAAIDLKTFRLPHALTLPLGVTGFILSFIPGNGLTPGESFLGIVSGLLPLGLLAWKRPATFGFGDAVFAASIGAFAGVAGLGLALVLGGIGALISFRIGKDRLLLPFGPFLALGGLVGLFGNEGVHGVIQLIYC